MFNSKQILIIFSTLAVVKCSQIKAAPYFMPLDNNPPDVVEAMKSSGLKHFILAFVLAPAAGGCIPTWDGNIKQKVSDDTKVLEIVKAIRAAGGDVSVSFGGYTGLELGSLDKACKTANELANAYQLVIDKYDLTNVDLDVEGDDLGDEDGEKNRFNAIRILKEKAKGKGKQLFVTLTMPSTTVGLSDLGRDEIRNAIKGNVTIDLYKVMAFDYGGPGSDQANSVIRIMELAHQQIKQLRTDLNDAQVYKATGLILMNGHTDQATELYELSTFEKLVNYAKDKDLGRVSFWALNRDRPCGNIKTGWVSGVCSSVEQKPYDFSKILATFDPNDSPVVTVGTVATTKPTQAPTQTTQKATERPTHEPEHTSTQKATDKPINTSTVPPSTSARTGSSTASATTIKVTYKPVIDGVDCRKEPDNKYFPYKNDCQEYIRCYNRLAHLEKCANGTIYDTKLHLCNWPASVDRPECK